MLAIASGLPLAPAFSDHMPTESARPVFTDYDRFRELCASSARAAEQSNSMSVAGRDGFFFLASELRHVGAGQFWGDGAARASRAAPGQADPLPAILDFNNQLKKMGVRLIVMPVPPKVVIYPEMLPGFTNGAAGPSPVHSQFYGLLQSNGVEVLDLTDTFLAAKERGEAPYCRQDSHWSGAGCVLAARALANALGTPTGVASNALRDKWIEVEIKGDLAPGGAAIPLEKMRLRAISDLSGAPLSPDRSSPVVLLGDSHNLVFHDGGDMLFKGAGLPDQMALALGYPVDLVAVRGSGATPARVNLLRRARQVTDYWAAKKCVVWCFAAREFTESDGWRKVPVFIASGGKEMTK